MQTPLVLLLCLVSSITMPLTLRGAPTAYPPLPPTSSAPPALPPPTKPPAYPPSTPTPRIRSDPRRLGRVALTVSISPRAAVPPPSSPASPPQPPPNHIPVQATLLSTASRLRHAD
ncbi:uncharacterized protein A4U43_C08F3470 [Asparagus officinalis]|nr:uncharacterized protein A4U43_C08F3470 [Asparagus officinalis]